MLDDLISSSNKSLETSLYVLLGSLPIFLSSFTGCLGHICFSVWQLTKSVRVHVWEHRDVFQRMMVRGVCEYAH